MKKAVIWSCVLLAVTTCAIWFGGRPAYHRFKERRALSQAKVYLGRKDYRNASLSARQALTANPRSIEACRIMAQLAEMARSAQVLDWRKRIVELSPTSDDKLMLAAVALRVQGPPYPVAAQVLEELAASSKNWAPYHVIAAELALRLNKQPEAETHFEIASRLEPANETHQINLAVLRLHSTNATISIGARATLERLSANTELAPVALRWLVADHVNRKDWVTARKVSDSLVTNPPTTLEDRLQNLEILQQLHDPNFAVVLAGTQKLVATNPAAIYVTAGWMAAHTLPDAALQWLTNLPPKLQTEPPVPFGKVECYFANKDWVGLQNYLESEKWGENDFLRLAFLSHAASGRGDGLTSDGRWRLAVRQAGDRLGCLVKLLSLAGSWERLEAQEDLLWLIAQRFPQERWALRDLQRVYFSTGNTRGWNKVAAALSAADPKDFTSRNDFAGTAMLLKLNLPKAYQTAHDLYRAHPEEPVIATTHAYALHLQGRTDDALKVMEKLKPDALENPSLALYYAVMLHTVGQSNKAEHYLGRTEGAKLLPEEKDLAALTRKALSSNP
jgi:tetratricopeptide (TPR) repeat protein